MVWNWWGRVVLIKECEKRYKFVRANIGMCLWRCCVCAHDIRMHVHVHACVGVSLASM